MSLTIIWPTNERILIGVDTLMSDRGILSHASKLKILAHLPCVIAGRGSGAMARSIANQIENAPATYKDFDTIIANGYDLVGRTWVELKRAMGRNGLEIPESLGVDVQELVFAGWSHKEGRMLCKCFLQFPSGVIEGQEIKGGTAGGWNSDAGPMPEPSTLEAMLGIASTTTKIVQAKRPGYPLGGRLLFTTITRDTVTTSNHDIP
jgi:hypothetical protein